MPQDNNKGLVLLYALLVMSLITAIAITVSIIVIGELKLTSGATDATLAYYAAESGVERGLYAVKIYRDSDVPLHSEIPPSVIDYIQGYMDNSGFANNAKYTDEDTGTQSSNIYREPIDENGYVQADFYDVDDPLDQTLPANSIIQSMRVENEVLEGEDPFSWVEVSWTAWDDNGELDYSTQARAVIGPSDLRNGWLINNLDVFGDITPVGYRIRIKALFGDLSAITITPYDQTDGNGNIVDLPSQVQIKSVGTKSKYKQSITASVPWKVPLFGLYDYVLYSEGDILKTIVLSSPTYSSGVIDVEANLDMVPDGYCSGCADCRTNGWLGLDCSLQPAGANIACCDGSSYGEICKLVADTNFSHWGFVLPIPDYVPQGDEYYVSVKATYVGCDEDSGSGAEDCGRDIAVEINGQSIIVGDQEPSDDVAVHTCTIPESFSLGDPALPEDDISRTVQFTVHPYGAASGSPGSDPGEWHADEYILLDWYQLSTYKIYPDCP